MIHEFMHLISDPAHLAFEVTTTLAIEAIGLRLAWPIIRRKIAQHDREEHSHG